MLKWAHLPMPRRLAICRLKKLTMCFVLICTPFPQLLENQIVSISLIAPCNFQYLQNVNLQGLAICRFTTSFYLVWMWLREQREPKTLLEFRLSCGGSGLIKLYIAIVMTSACLFSKHNCWSKVGNMPATVLLVKWITSWFWILVQWHQTDRRTESDA